MYTNNQAWICSIYKDSKHIFQIIKRYQHKLLSLDETMLCTVLPCLNILAQSTQHALK